MDKPTKQRLDHALTDLQLADSGTQAQALIRAGQVTVNQQKVTQPSQKVCPASDTITVDKGLPFVSRGGLKLQQALANFAVSPNERVCIDVGASTGGFTDCLLQQGATHVYAVDVGYGQLDWKLRNDPRVTVLERFNIRHATPEQFNPPANLAVVDVSFISLKKVLPVVAVLLQPFGDSAPEMLTLVKPQFEYGDYFPRKGFRGVVKGDDVLIDLLSKVVPDIQALLPGWHLNNLDYSPITGPKGNREFLAHWVSGEHTTSPFTTPEVLQLKVAQVVEASRLAEAK